MYRAARPQIASLPSLPLPVHLLLLSRHISRRAHSTATRRSAPPILTRRSKTLEPRRRCSLGRRSRGSGSQHHVEDVPPQLVQWIASASGGPCSEYQRPDGEIAAQRRDQSRFPASSPVIDVSVCFYKHSRSLASYGYDSGCIQRTVRGADVTI